MPMVTTEIRKASRSPGPTNDRHVGHEGAQHQEIALGKLTSTVAL